MSIDIWVAHSDGVDISVKHIPNAGKSEFTLDVRMDEMRVTLWLTEDQARSIAKVTNYAIYDAYGPAVKDFEVTHKVCSTCGYPIAPRLYVTDPVRYDWSHVAEDGTGYWSCIRASYDAEYVVANIAGEVECADYALAHLDEVIE